MASLSELLDQLNEEETEQLLEGLEGPAASRKQKAALLKKTRQRIGIEKKAEKSGRGPKRQRFIRRAAAAAAALILLIGGGIGLHAYAEETKEYQEAVQFFEANNLSTEGLSRVEIKAVYRDIATQSFRYDKTAQVIEKSLDDESVPGFEIEQHAPTPEQLKALWEYGQIRRGWRSREWVGEAKPGEERIRFEIKYQYKDVVLDDGEIHTEGDFVSSAFTKYDGEQLLWEAVFTEFSVSDHEEVEDGILVWGETPATYYSIQDANWIQYAWLAKLSPEGEILWQKRLDNGHRWERIRAVVEETEAYVVLSGGQEETTFQRLSKDGVLREHKLVSFGRYSVSEAIRYENGFLAIAGAWDQPDELLLLDTDGTVLRTLTYDSGDTVYYLKDLALWNGKIVLSATAVPKMSKQYGREEIAYTLDHIFGSEPYKWEISSKELTPIVRENYSALLLICDLSKDTPESFYTVAGSRAGELRLDGEGRLQWDVENIAEAYFSPATNAFTIYGTSYLVNYVFSADGSVEQKQTDEIVRFFR